MFYFLIKGYQGGRNYRLKEADNETDRYAFAQGKGGHFRCGYHRHHRRPGSSRCPIHWRLLPVEKQVCKGERKIKPKSIFPYCNKLMGFVKIYWENYKLTYTSFENEINKHSM